MVKVKIEAILDQISKVIPENMQDIKHDLKKNLRATLNTTFSNMNLVTREEFDIQSALLQRTRAQLDTLQKTISSLEKKLAEKDETT